MKRDQFNTHYNLTDYKRVETLLKLEQDAGASAMEQLDLIEQLKEIQDNYKVTLDDILYLEKRIKDWKFITITLIILNILICIALRG